MSAQVSNRRLRHRDRKATHPRQRSLLLNRLDLHGESAEHMADHPSGRVLPVPRCTGACQPVGRP
eukprot:3647125-Alexandrium_andersonii.AAC.1